MFCGKDERGKGDDDDDDTSALLSAASSTVSSVRNEAAAAASALVGRPPAMSVQARSKPPWNTTIPPESNSLIGALTFETPSHSVSTPWNQSLSNFPASPTISTPGIPTWFALSQVPMPAPVVPATVAATDARAVGSKGRGADTTSVHQSAEKCSDKTASKRPKLDIPDQGFHQAFKTSGPGTNSSVAAESARSRRGDSPLSLAEGFLGAEPGRSIGDDEAFLGTPGDAPLGAGTGAGVGVKQTMSTTPISTDSLLRSFTWPEPPSSPAPSEVSASHNPSDSAVSPAAGASKPGATTAEPTAAQGNSQGLTAPAANTGTSKTAPISKEAAPG
mmetsp:Transcript_51503/g.107591  ORF Transcript_51503/g.107591 Transcript_51503/m.107591 type:complete len:332 (-) Transcript_51503:596-1591(-)